MQKAMRCIDLHTHSTYSDGDLSPAELILFAEKSGLSALSLTDHDTMAGTEEALAQGCRSDIEVIPGIELSAVYNQKTMHILGYGLSHQDPDLATLLQTIQQERQRRNLDIIARLQKLGIPLSQKHLASQGRGQIGRPHIAKLMVECGAVQSVDQAFAKYLKDGGRAFVQCDKPNVGRVIETIIKAGGLAVLAHPAMMDPSLTDLPTLLAKLKDMGLEGIEAYYPTHSSRTQAVLITLARKMDLLITGGSDFHFPALPGSKRGAPSASFRIPYSLLEQLKMRLARDPVQLDGQRIARSS